MLGFLNNENHFLNEYLVSYRALTQPFQNNFSAMFLMRYFGDNDGIELWISLCAFLQPIF